MGKKNTGNGKYDAPRRKPPGGSGSMGDIFKNSDVPFEIKDAGKVEEEEKEKKKHTNYGPTAKAKKSRENYSGGKNKANFLPLDIAPHAPYNFVRIDDRVMETPSVPVHNMISGEDGEERHYTGYLTYRLTAQTPILIGAGKQGRDRNGSPEEFYRDKDGACAIPGSTMRGLIRSNAQVLSFSRVCGDIDDYNLMYRAVADGCLKDEYGSVLGQRTKVINGHRMTLLENVRAGYIRCDGKRYRIYQNKGDNDGTFKAGEADYYTVSEHYVLDHAIDDFAELLPDFHNMENTEVDENGNRKPNFTEWIDRNGGKHYLGIEREKYVPYEYEITYALSNNKVVRIRKKGSNKGNLKKEGVVISSGAIKEKKAFYVIPEIDEEHYIDVPEASVTAFRIDYNRREKSLSTEKDEKVREKTRKFFQLPADGETRPVFYIELDGRLYFGYTPRLRLMYAHTISEGIHQPKKQADARIPGDYTEGMFGYTDENSALKSRVFFTDAVLQGKAETEKTVSLVLAEPKPTSYLEYLEQEQNAPVKTHNSDEFRLRGVKQYWLQERAKKGDPSAKESIGTVFRPLSAGSIFDGTVRFRNLTEEELGLLIWSIRLEENSQMNIGKAKPYGYGRVKVSGLSLNFENTAKMYTADISAFSVHPYVKQDDKMLDDLVEKWVKKLENFLGVSTREEVLENPALSDFFYMKSHIMKSGDRNAEYMGLSTEENKKKNEHRKDRLDGYSEFKQRNNPLPTADSFKRGEQ